MLLTGIVTGEATSPDKRRYRRSEVLVRHLSGYATIRPSEITSGVPVILPHPGTLMLSWEEADYSVLLQQTKRLKNPVRVGDEGLASRRR